MTKDSESEFVDDIDKALKLIEKMKEHLPIIVRPTSALVKNLRIIPRGMVIVAL